MADPIGYDYSHNPYLPRLISNLSSGIAFVPHHHCAMTTQLHPILTRLLQTPQLSTAPDLALEEAPASLTQAFLILLAGPQQPQFLAAKDLLQAAQTQSAHAELARFYQQGLQRIHAELADPAVAQRFSRSAADWNHLSDDELAEATWSVFFPEAVGIYGQEADRIAQLRQRRTVTLSQLASEPITNPAQQLLLTSNALLTVPLASTPISELPFDDEFCQQLQAVAQEPQLYWYDHPIPIGIKPENNEILYGLRALNQALEVERQRGHLGSQPVPCALSVSVTHKGLQTLAKEYLRQTLAADAPLHNLKIFAFTEADTEALVQQVLRPAVERYCPTPEASELLSVFGVDGRYGRHYSFLKAISALWQALVDDRVQGTFKIDLDQVFPQTELIDQTGASAFEHLMTPLWGARGTDAWGRPIELGLIAGALVNQKDIHQGLFTPDVPFPPGPKSLDDYIFFSPLPQALSTEAEMMTRYQPGSEWDGETTCLQRIHVTGGTNGIRIDSLRRHRPFTPSFIGRAEDQAYILSTFTQSDPGLGYAHAAGLIMRHDKEGFAQEAIKLAKMGKLVGDYVRILMFSAYARTLNADITPLKAVIDPFTGGFISAMPVTVVLLRFALKLVSLYHQGEIAQAQELIRIGIPQLQEALAFTEGDESQLAQAYRRERRGWELFYQVLDQLQAGVQQGDAFALARQRQARQWVTSCAVN